MATMRSFTDGPFGGNPVEEDPYGVLFGTPLPDLPVAPMGGAGDQQASAASTSEDVNTGANLPPLPPPPVNATAFDPFDPSGQEDNTDNLTNFAPPQQGNGTGGSGGGGTDTRNVANPAWVAAYKAANPNATDQEAASHYFGDSGNWWSGKGPRSNASGFTPQPYVSPNGGGAGTDTGTGTGTSERNDKPANTYITQLLQGTNPMDTAIANGIGGVIGREGMTGAQRSLLDRVSRMIDEQGALPADAAIRQSGLESARESEAAANSAMLKDARAELASRGLVSEPGIPQGEEGNAISRITQSLAPGYSRAVRDVETDVRQSQEGRLQNAIAQATGITSSAAANLVGVLGEGSQRSVGLANIALQTLSQNTQWNEFLAQFGLNQDVVLNQIQSGNTTALTTLINMFQNLSGTTAQGFI